MSLRSYMVLKSELKNLRSFYKETLQAYQKTLEMELFRQNSPSEFERIFKSKSIKRSRNKKRRGMEKKRDKATSILRELILVRVISALETYLTDAIRDVFVVTKAPFLDKSVHLTFSQEELISNNTPTQIFSRIINKETRKLTSGGFNEFIKYYKKRLDIDLSSITPGYKIMYEYHDRRHILVHRLGQTDESYRKKYNTDQHKLEIDSPYIERLITDIENFSSSLNEQVNKIITNSILYPYDRNARYIIDILFLKQEMPNCLQPDFQFWADDEYVVMSDLLIGTSPSENGRVRHYFNGSNRALNKLQQFLRKEQKNLSISILVAVDFSARNKKNVISTDLVERVQSKLPEQPWPTGIHKQIAKDLNISNKIVSKAIDVLISSGAFKKQVNGKIVLNNPYSKLS